MGGGAWPFLVGGVICLVNSDNERDLSLLNSYANTTAKKRWCTRSGEITGSSVRAREGGSGRGFSLSFFSLLLSLSLFFPPLFSFFFSSFPGRGEKGEEGREREGGGQGSGRGGGRGAVSASPWVRAASSFLWGGNLWGLLFSVFLSLRGEREKGKGVSLLVEFVAILLRGTVHV